MVTHSPEEEVKQILDVIEKYFPKVFQAPDSIKWLHKHTSQGRQVEWAAQFFEEYCRPLLTTFLGGWYGVRIIKGKRVDYQRHYNWDLKVHSIKNSNDRINRQIILNDKDAVERIIKLESGMGFIVASVKFTFDTKGSLSKWRDQYEEKTRSGSSRARVMKSGGTVVGLGAIFIKDMAVLEKGMKDGWISLFKQGQQPTGAARKPKYQIDLYKVPHDMWINPDGVSANMIDLLEGGDGVVQDLDSKSTKSLKIKDRTPLNEQKT